MSSFITKAVIGIFALIIIGSVFSSINKSRRPPYDPSKHKPAYSTSTTITPSSELTTAGDQFDLKILDTLLRETTSPEELEKRLNASEPRLHNLDLDENNQVDFIKVREFGTPEERGLSFTVDLEPVNGEPQTQEIASIIIRKVDDKNGTYEVRGNENVYGRNHYYRSGFGIGDFLIMSMLMNSNRTPYNPGWNHQNRPDYYSPRSPMDNDAYRASASNMTRGSTMTPTSTLSSTVTSPDAGKTASNVRAPLKNPTATQQSFQSRNPSKQVRSGGFGSGSTASRTSSSTSSSSSRPSQPSVRTSSSTRSRSSSGGGK